MPAWLIETTSPAKLGPVSTIFPKSRFWTNEMVRGLKIRAVAVAYRDLTGEPGFVWDDLRGQYRGGLLDLGRDIEAHFGGAGLFAARRLRFISETLDS